MSFTQFPLKSAFHTAIGPRTKTKKLTLILLLNKLQTLFRFCLLRSFLCASVQSRTPLCIQLSHLFSLLCSVTVSFLFSKTLAVLERMVQVFYKMFFRLGLSGISLMIGIVCVGDNLRGNTPFSWHMWGSTWYQRDLSPGILILVTCLKQSLSGFSTLRLPFHTRFFGSES